MEVDCVQDDQLAPANGLTPWIEQSLRHVRYDAVRSTIFARQAGIVQKTYHFERNEEEPLAIRFCSGMLFKGATGHLVWLLGYVDSDHEVLIGIEPSYLFERTGCLVNQRVIAWGGKGVVDLMAICQTALGPISDVLNLRLERFLDHTEIPQKPPARYLSVDHLQHSRLIVQSGAASLDHMEQMARHYCQSYWEAHERWSQKVSFRLNIFLYPTKRIWTSTELADLAVGDLIRLQNFGDSDHLHRLRGALQFKRRDFNSKRYEVFFEMNEDDTRLKFGSEPLDGSSLEDPVSATEAALPPHETIELEIMAGSTKILFSELCAIQEGSLIEMRDHVLPEVTLSVMGSPILLGELVYFQDQIMVQVTKRLG